nr:wiskott-Aldrich syndrome protein homolog 1-like [Aegilops tauschii subsp. strangulata]
MQRSHSCSPKTRLSPSVARFCCLGVAAPVPSAWPCLRHPAEVSTGRTMLPPASSPPSSSSSGRVALSEAGSPLGSPAPSFAEMVRSGHSLPAPPASPRPASPPSPGPLAPPAPSRQRLQSIVVMGEGGCSYSGLRPPAPSQDAVSQEWHVVSRKGKKGGRRPPTGASVAIIDPSTSGNGIHGGSAYKADLLGRCFRCLSSSHRVASCHSDVRCLHCLVLGHTTHHCPSRHLPRVPLSSLAEPTRPPTSPASRPRTHRVPPGPPLQRSRSGSISACLSYTPYGRALATC